MTAHLGEQQEDPEGRASFFRSLFDPGEPLRAGASRLASMPCAAA